MKLFTSLFALALIGGWMTTEGAVTSDTSMALGDVDGNARADVRKLDRAALEASRAADDHGHENPVLDVAIDLAAVVEDERGLERLDYDIMVTANAAAGIEYTYTVAIEDDTGVERERIAPGQVFALDARDGLAHRWLPPTTLAPGFYKAMVTARTGDGAEARISTFFEVAASGSVVPLDRVAWLAASEATLGTSVPARAPDIDSEETTNDRSRE